MLMTASFGIGSFVMVLAVNLAGPLAVTAQITARISDGIRCYFAPALQKSRGFLRAPPGSLTVFLRIISRISQASRSGRLDSVALSRYWSGIVVDLSRPACGHVKEALKGREF
jgi:hypothetical protein